jgi:hypothetical protein
MDRAAAEALGWQFAADQVGYVRAEKQAPSGKLINHQGETEDEVLLAIDAWESWPIKVAGPVAAEVQLEEAPEPEPVDTGEVAA